MKTIAVLGRQPKIGLAELESVFGSNNISELGKNYALVNQDISYVKARDFGSVIKFVKILKILPYMPQDKIGNNLILLIEQLSININSKINFGISFYEYSIDQSVIEKFGLKAKNILKKNGKSSRFISSKNKFLSTAQIINNKLDGRNGLEIVVIADGHQVYLCRTIYEQDINAYTARDQARPKRDSFVGMLPPKLAQTIINLATKDNKGIDKIVLDPFCGTGVVLQEALLMGFSAYGSDLNPKMVKYSQDNIEWLKNRFSKKQYGQIKIELGDATNHHWNLPINFVASETYLGSPISMSPDPEKLQRLIEETNQLHIDALNNLGKQISKQTRLCLALPAWRTKQGLKSLPMLDQLGKIGYNLIDFKYSKASDLIYIRDNQFVGRQLVVLEKK